VRSRFTCVGGTIRRGVRDSRGGIEGSTLLERFTRLEVALLEGNDSGACVVVDTGEHRALGAFFSEGSTDDVHAPRRADAFLNGRRELVRARCGLGEQSVTSSNSSKPRRAGPGCPGSAATVSGIDHDSLNDQT